MNIYKIGNDTIDELEFIDNQGAAITLSSLHGYGVRVFSPTSELIGEWGVNVPGFETDSNIFEKTNTNICTLRLNSDLYGRNFGYVTAELVILYTMAEFPDTKRDLTSEAKLKIFELRK